LKKEERFIYISKELQKLYPETPIPLDHDSIYTLLIAVLLSAQCTDVRVNQVTPELFKLANNPFDMSLVDPDEIRKIIRPCGLSPKKSKAIAELSKILCEKYEGQVPESFEALEALPGVGHKTASVVMSQGFNHPAFPIDTHIHRLAQRWRLSRGKNVKQTEKDLKKGFPIEDWNKLHLQIIFYGREYCTARGCDGRVCKICSEVNKGRKSPVKTNKA
jgi:endonuclease-3|tara:strand:+ start:1720 stop:2373 length:654 start_codon:yes stop_codon:yes gene_type:complete